MDVTLPSGHVVTDVPEGTSQRDLLDKLARRGGYEDDVQAMQREHIVRPIGVEGLKQATHDVAGEMNPAQRFAGNYALGGHNLWEGVKGLFTDDSEERKRTKAVKEQFATETPGGEYVQMAGETIPTLAVPAGWAGQGGKALVRAVPKLGSMAAKATPILGPRAANVANIAASQGLLSAATTAGDWEDRARSGLFAGAAGSALPAAVGIAQTGRRMITPTGQKLHAAERFLQEIGGGEDAEKLITSLEQQGPTRFTQAGVAQPTAAQLTGDPMLRELETGLRAKHAPAFAAGDEAAAQGRANRLQGIAGTPEDLVAAERARDAATKPLREEALGAAGQVKGFEEPVTNKALGLAYGETRPIQQVQTMTKYVLDQLDQGVTPQQLYSVRKQLTSAVPHGTELGSAISASRAERMALVEAIDNALDNSSGGKWRQYLKTYEAGSQPVTSMKAGQAIQKDFAGAAQTAEGDPIYTASKLRQAIARHGEKTFGGKVKPRVTEGERSTMESIADSIEASDRARKSQGLIGSATAGNIQAADRATLLGQLTGGLASQIPYVGKAIPVLQKARQERYERVLAELMQDPERLAEFLRRAQQAGGITGGTGQLLGRIGQVAGRF